MRLPIKDFDSQNTVSLTLGPPGPALSDTHTNICGRIFCSSQSIILILNCTDNYDVTKIKVKSVTSVSMRGFRGGAGRAAHPPPPLFSGQFYKNVIRKTLKLTFKCRFSAPSFQNLGLGPHFLNFLESPLVRYLKCVEFYNWFLLH